MHFIKYFLILQYLHSFSNVSKHAATFSRCFGESVADQNACAGEAILSIFLLCMIIVLILKIWSMGPYSDLDYVRRLFNLELFVEIVVRTLALSCLAIQHNMYYLKFCAAFGIFFAFIGNHYQRFYDIVIKSNN